MYNQDNENKMYIGLSGTKNLWGSEVLVQPNEPFCFKFLQRFKSWVVKISPAKGKLKGVEIQTMMLDEMLKRLFIRHKNLYTCLGYPLEMAIAYGWDPGGDSFSPASEGWGVFLENYFSNHNAMEGSLLDLIQKTATIKAGIDNKNLNNGGLNVIL